MLLAILLGKLSRWFIRLFRPGGGSSIPGKIALLIYPRLIEKLRAEVGIGVIAVSGSAGKSTSTKLIVAILRAHGLQVFTNESTANIEQGLASSLIRVASLTGRLRRDVWVLELDEGHAAKLAHMLRPDVCLLTNLMTDQLDRFDDPEEVLQKLRELATQSKKLVLNADDPHLASIRHDAVKQFAASAELLGSEDAPELAPFFGELAPTRTEPDLVVGRTAEGDLSIAAGGNDYRVQPRLSGSHNAMNIAAAWLTTAVFLDSRSDFGQFVAVIAQTEPVFARDETVTIGGRTVRLLLVQNPGSFRLNLQRVGDLKEPLMIAIGSDVHDPSWIWAIDFSQFSKVQLTSGLNGEQLALWLHYQGIAVEKIQTDVAAAADRFLADLNGSRGTIILTADAMRRFRRHFRLAK